MRILLCLAAVGLVSASNSTNYTHAQIGAMFCKNAAMYTPNAMLDEAGGSTCHLEIHELFNKDNLSSFTPSNATCHENIAGSGDVYIRAWIVNIVGHHCCGNTTANNGNLSACWPWSNETEPREYHKYHEYLENVTANYSDNIDKHHVECMSHEIKCMDPEWGYEWCQDTKYACPCTGREFECSQESFDAMGMPTGNFSTKCVTSASQCTCGANALPQACNQSWGGMACMPKTMGSCPVVCSFEEQTCMSPTFASDGSSTGNYTTTCQSWNTSCPCNPTWEETCTETFWNDYDQKNETWSYCASKEWGGCPLNCGDQPNCWGMEYHSNGSYKLDKYGWPKSKESCGSNGTCSSACHPEHENMCTEWGYSYCKPKFEGSCPVDCSANGTETCYQQHYLANGDWDYNAGAICVADYAACMAQQCGRNTKTCTFTSEWGTDAFCIFKNESCPLSCNTTQMYCMVDSFDANGFINGSTESCADMNAGCPCAASQKKCNMTWDDMSWMECFPSNESCPLTCTANQQHCFTYDVDAQGFPLGETYNESCVPVGTPCPCGANQHTCTETYDGESWSYCLPKVMDGFNMSCPVQCKDDEYRYWVANFGENGSWAGGQDKCFKKGDLPTCGTHSQLCAVDTSWFDGEGDFYYPDKECWPKWDEYTNTKMSCPITCKSTETHCTVCNFDDVGNCLTFTEYCSATDKCDCSRGTNAKECTEHGWSYCMPKTGYCPKDCADGKVQCPEVDNFNKQGDWVRSEPPPKGQECKDSWSDCPCGQNAKECTDDFGYKYCQASAWACPVYCSDGQESCTIVNWNDDGTVKSMREKCLSASETCPCGTGTVKCKIDGFDECVPKAFAATVCPCKATETTCKVQDYDQQGVPALEMRTTCVKKGDKCGCGKNAKSCSDGDCIPAGGREQCPKRCLPADEAAGNKTCTKTSFSNGKVQGTHTSCVKPEACKPGTGQKVCPHGSMILEGFKCENLYGLPISKKTRRRLKTGARHLSAVKLASNTKQTATIKFTLKDVKNSATSTDVKAAGAKLGSIVQLLPSHEAKLTMVKNGNNADMTYTVSNNGATAVTPKKVTEKLKEKLNTKDPAAANALATIGTVVVGNSGCCILATTSKEVKDKPKAGNGGSTTNSPGGGTSTTSSGSGSTTSSSGSSGLRGTTIAGSTSVAMMSLPQLLTTVVVLALFLAWSL